MALGNNRKIRGIFAAFGLGVGLCCGIGLGYCGDYDSSPENTHEFDFSPYVEPFIEKVRKTELLIEAIIQIESQGDPFSVGSSGERGLMQIKRETWLEVTAWMFGKEISFDRAFVPELNRRVGRAYLADLQIFIHRYRDYWMDDERNLLLACYNAGPVRVLEAGFDINKLSAANRDYVQRASTLHEYYLAGQGIIDAPEFVFLDNSGASAGF